MAKCSVQWHQGCLVNQRFSLNRKLAEFNRLREEVLREQRSLTFYEGQIRAAETAGMLEFDSEKFMKPRKKKN